MRNHWLEVKPNKTYTIGGTQPKLILFFDKQGREIARSNVFDTTKKNHSFAVPEDCTGIKVKGWVKHYDINQS